MRPALARGVFVGLALLPAAAAGQDDANAEARAAMELRQQQQEMQAQGGGAAPLTGTLGVVPGGTLDPPPADDPALTDQGGRRIGERNPHGPREEVYRNPDLDYRNRPPRRDDRWRPPRHVHRPPVYPPPVVIVRPPPIYYPPPVYDPWPPRHLAGPVPGVVVWSLFPPFVVDRLSPSARLSHERAFIAALSAPVGVTQSWRWNGVRGDVTVIGEYYDGIVWCRDFVQTIRAPGVARTVDGRACISPGQSWRLVAY